MKLWINFGKYNFNRKTGEIIYYKPVKNPTIDFSLANWEIIKSQDGLEYFFNSSININTWRLPQRLTFNLEEYYPYKGPTYGTKKRGNTCFMDSVIVAIFSSIDPFTNYLLYSPTTSMSQYKINPCKGTGPISSMKTINSIRKELRNLRGMLVDSDRKNESLNIHRLLEKIKTCGGDVKNFCSGGMGEVVRFINWILQLLPVSECSINQESKFVSEHGKIWKRFKNIWNFNSFPFYLIPRHKIVAAKSGILLSTFMKNSYEINSFSQPTKLDSMKDGKLYSKVVDINSIKYCPVLFVRAVRLNYDNEFIKNKIIPDEFLTLESGQKLRLTSIIIFSASHYWCYFYVPGSDWFYYNDLTDKGTPTEIGNYQDLINEDEVTKNGVIYKYSVIETDYWGQDMPWLETIPQFSDSSSLSESSSSSMEEYSEEDYSEED